MEETYDGLDNGCALGADGDGVGGVLDVAAGYPAAVGTEDCAADAEVGVWACASVSPGLLIDWMGYGQYATPFAAMVRVESSFSSSAVRP